jgi:endonuclease/exonuclease/phosphatase family metal-dependent hydrolase
MVIRWQLSVSVWVAISIFIATAFGSDASSVVNDIPAGLPAAAVPLLVDTSVTSPVPGTMAVLPSRGIADEALDVAAVGYTTIAQVLEDSFGVDGLMAATGNASLAPVRHLVAVAMNALNDHLSGTYTRLPRRRWAVVAVHSVVATPMALRGELAAHRPAGLPDLLPTVFTYPDREKAFVELGVMQEVRLMVLRCGKAAPEDLVLRMFTVTATRVRSLITLLSMPVDMDALPYRSQQFVKSVDSLLHATGSGFCSLHTDGAAVPKPATAKPPSAAPSAPRADLRVMSYNLWNFNRDWFERCNQISRIIRDASPDVLLMQELRIDVEISVTRTIPRLADALPSTKDVAGHHKIQSRQGYLRHSTSQIEHVMRRVRTKLPYWFDHLPAMTYSPQLEDSPIRGFGTRQPIPRSQTEGPAIATRYQTIGSFAAFLPGTRLATGDHEQGDDHQRLLLCQALLVPSSKLHRKIRIDFCTTHFSLSPRAQALNVQGSVVTMEALAQRTVRGMLASFTVFAGDLNNEPPSETIQHLLRSGYVDVYEQLAAARYVAKPTPCQAAFAERIAAAGDSGEGVFDDGLGPHGFTFNNVEDALEKRIDFVLTHRWATAGDDQLCPVGLRHVGRKEASLPTPSDHVALVADFEVLPS